MKKYIIVFILICMITLTGCNKKELSKKYTIILNGNPSTGYNWTYEIDNKDIVKIDESTESSCENGMSGCPSNFIYTTTGLKEGKVTITFTYKRSWEETEYDLNAIYELEVDKDLNIVELNHTGSYFEKEE